jgi:hypothetical protein
MSSFSVERGSYALMVNFNYYLSVPLTTTDEDIWMGINCYIYSGTNRVIERAFVGGSMERFPRQSTRVSRSGTASMMAVVVPSYSSDFELLCYKNFEGSNATISEIHWVAIPFDQLNVVEEDQGDN